MNIGKSIISISSGVVATLALVGTASAHVKVFPETSTVGAWEEYTMRVPTEKTIPTTKIVLKTPSNLEVEQYQGIPGWKYSTLKDSKGHVTELVWTATSGGILPGQFQEFKFVAQNPKSPGTVDWDAYQYYQDGSIVEWTGPESSATPHAKTSIIAAAGATESPSEGTKATSMPVASTKTSDSPVPTILSGVAVLLSVISLVVAFRKRQ